MAGPEKGERDKAASGTTTILREEGTTKRMIIASFPYTHPTGFEMEDITGAETAMLYPFNSKAGTGAGGGRKKKGSILDIKKGVSLASLCQGKLS